jgi:hypothetical protein
LTTVNINEFGKAGTAARRCEMMVRNVARFRIIDNRTPVSGLRPVTVLRSAHDPSL